MRLIKVLDNICVLINHLSETLSGFDFKAEKPVNNQPAMRNKPPIGVTGPSHLTLSIPINLAVDKMYRDPEKRTIPAIKL